MTADARAFQPHPDDDSPSVIGGGAADSTMPTRADAEEAWRRLYIERMIERGVEREDAQACCIAGDVDLSVDPRDAADDELQYWTED